MREKKSHNSGNLEADVRVLSACGLESEVVDRLRINFALFHSRNT